MVPIAGTVPLVGAPARDHLNFGASRAGVIDASVVGLYAKFFQAFNRSGNDGAGSRLKAGVVAASALHVGGSVAAVDHERILVGARSGHRAAIIVGLTASARAVEPWN